MPKVTKRKRNHWQIQREEKEKLEQKIKQLEEINNRLNREREILEERINTERGIWNNQKNELEEENMELQIELKAKQIENGRLKEENEIREEVIRNMGNQLQTLEREYRKLSFRGFYAINHEFVPLHMFLPLIMKVS